MTGLIIAGCLGVFVYQVVLLARGEGVFEAWVMRHALVPSRLLAGVGDAAQWQTVVTSMFLHGGVAHVLGNCWFLRVFGRAVEGRLGGFGFMVFYLFAGVAAALAQIAAGPGSEVPMVGASGAISGVLGAYLVFYPKAWVVSLVPWVVPIVPVPAVVFLLLWFVAQAYAGVGSLMDGSAGGGGVAWWAHAGGFVAGVVLAKMWPKGGPVKRG